MLGHGQTFLTLSTAGSEAGWERGGTLLSTAFFGVSLFKKKVTQCGPLNPGAAWMAGNPLPTSRMESSLAGRKGTAQQGCVNTRRVLQSSTQCLSSQVGH